MKKLCCASAAVLLTVGLFSTVYAKKVTISFMEVGEPAKIIAAKKCIEIFEKLHPNIAVKYTPVSYGEWSDKLLSMIAAGTPFDVSPMYDCEHNPTLTKCLDPFISRDKFVMSQYLPETLKVKTQVNKGRRFGLPYGMTAPVLVYNKDLFSQSGVQEPPQKWEETTWTWDAFVGAAKKLTRDTNGDGKPDQWGVAEMTHMPNIYPFMWGQSIFNDDFTEFVCNSAAGAKAFQSVADLVWKEKVQPSSGSNFTAGKQAMMIHGAWDMPYWRKTKFKWDLAATPIGTKRATYVLVDNLFMAAACKHPQEAWEFIKFMTTSADAQKSWVFEGNGKVPAVKALRSWYLQQAGGVHLAECNLDVIFDALPYNAVNKDLSHAPYNLAQISPIWSNGLAKIFANKSTAQEVLNAMKPQIDKLLKPRK